MEDAQKKGPNSDYDFDELRSEDDDDEDDDGNNSGTNDGVNEGVNEDNIDDLNSLAMKEAQLSSEILDLQKSIKAKDTIKLRKEADQVSPMQQLIKAKKKIKRLEADRKILMKVKGQPKSLLWFTYYYSGLPILGLPGCHKRPSPH